MLAIAAALAADPGLRLVDGPRPAAYAIELTIDPAETRFSGREVIRWDLDAPTRVVWLNSRGLDLTAVTVDGTPARFRASGEWLRIDLPARAQRFATELTWSGPIDMVATQGVFAQVVEQDRYVFSQFEATDARAAFPGLDQPDVKTPFDLTLRVPDGTGAFANTPVATEEDEPGPMRRVHFLPTRPLPTYLLAFAVGPFEVVDAGTAGRGNTPIRIVVPRGRSGWAGEATRRTGQALEALERYFDQPYPYPKLDVVTIPVTVGFGAMENPGLITCAQQILLARPEDDTLARRREYASVIAHELAHQWFGDLVTLGWWEDLWLNESFASWMGDRVLAELEPGWHMDVSSVGGREYAMGLDGLPSSRQIREPITTFADIESAFDGITYAKGQAVLGMFEAWLGADVFRAGVRSYLTAHADGTGTTEDFIAAISSAAQRDISGPFRSFLDQPGVPAVRVQVDGSALVLEQQRFLPPGVRGAPGHWEIPVCVRWRGSNPTCTLLTEARQRWEIPGLDPASLVPDAGATGYWRPRLDEAQVTALLAKDSDLTLPERVATVANASAMVEAGELAPGVVIGAVPELLTLGQPKVLEATVPVVAALDDHLVPEDLRPNYERMVRTLYGETARALGMAAKPGEDEDTRLLRPTLIALVGGPGGDADLAAAARTLADQWLTDRTGVDPELVEPVLALAARDGDRAMFERLVVEVRKEPDQERRQRIFGAIGSMRNPDLARAALDLALDGGFDIRESFGLLFGPLGHRETRDVAWAWLQSNVDRLAAKLPVIARPYLPMAGNAFCDRTHRAEVESFFRPRVRKWPGAAHNLDLVLEAIDTCVVSTERQLPGVRAVLEGY